MKRLDPATLAERQLARDRMQTKTPVLLARKTARMSASSFGFLRGSAPLFYEVLERAPRLASGPDGTGWIAGDLHLENFGAYRAGAPHEPEHAGVAFDVNDFDDAVIGPHRIDALRLATSAILMARDAGVNGSQAIAIAGVLLDGYAGAIGHDAPPKTPAPVARLLGVVRGRTRQALLAARTAGHGTRRRFVRGERYHDVAPKLRQRAEAAFSAWAKATCALHRIDREALEILDVAFRVAGTGSLGALRLAVLVRGKGGRDGAWIFELKEEGRPSPATLFGAPKGPAAERVVAAMRACQAAPPKLLGAVKLDDLSMLVRRLTPQEDKLSLADVRPEDIEPMAAYLGALAAHAHRRGATKPPKRAWKRSARAALLDSAVELAGIHQAAYLHYCQLLRA